MLDALFKKPELGDKELIQEYFRKYPTRSCERTFANVLLWSCHYGTTFAKIHNTLVFSSDIGDASFSFPAGEEEDVKAAIDEILAYTKEKGIPFRMYHVTPKQWEKLEAWYPDKFEIEYDRDVADYVYESEKLATLAGKKLHAKRNHINKFKATYENWSYEAITEDNIKDCMKMAQAWRVENGCDENVEKKAELCVTLNSLRLFKELDLVGGVLRIDGNVVAFTLGEPVNEDTFVVHIEKAFADIQGAYPMINQQFVEHEGMKFQYINREDDTGAENLRKAKLSYRPAFLIEKGVVKEK